MVAIRAACLLAIVAIALAFAARPAFAQVDEGDAPAAQQATPTPPEPAGFTGTHSPHEDRFEGHDAGMALLFWAFAAATVGGALFVISRRNLIAAVMGMVGSFLGIAAVYMMLYASFLAVVQMLVYAGAIMVLFVFVIMILNRPEDEPVAPTGRAGTVVGGLAIAYMVGRLALLLGTVNPPAGAVKLEAARNELAAARGARAVARPGVDKANAERTIANNLAAAELQYAKIAALQAPEPRNGHDWGSIKAVGTDLFDGGLFPFEAISILLLVAVVGAIAIARPLKDDTTGHAGDLP
jgi:NADH:ubiquinone oxidoreductase subunit 6 (subunit J)